ncbi:MAG: hypothetical protein ABI555_04790 [Chloroflexota bacterium]
MGGIEATVVIPLAEERWRAVEDTVGARSPGFGFDILAAELQEERCGTVRRARRPHERGSRDAAGEVAATADMWADDKAQRDWPVKSERSPRHDVS